MPDSMAATAAAAPAASAAASPFPTPVFEGSEKRIEIDFAPAAVGAGTAAGLRSLSRGQLDVILDQAACCIVSARNGVELDTYVLSESSLFIYPCKAILKTCGTTQLLAAVPALMAAAASAGMEPYRAKYSRASFLFPEQQPKMHNSFGDETRLLQTAFASMGGISGAYVLGDALVGLQWHVYVAQRPDAGAWHKPQYTLEVCMTGLAPEKAVQFARGPTYESAQATTKASGIQSLLATHDIDDYVFEPCGYSMNGMAGLQHSTIHITPEDGFSYASVEASSQAKDELDTERMVAQIARIFEPAEIAVAMTVDGAAGDTAWATAAAVLSGYTVSSDSRQALRGGGIVSYVTLAVDNAAVTDAAPVKPARRDSSDSDLSETAFSEAPCPPVPAPLDRMPSAYSSDSEGADSLDFQPAAGTKPAQLVPGSGAFPPPIVGAVLAARAAAPLPAVDVPALDTHIGDLIAQRSLDDTFYVMDLGVVAALHAAWARLMPRVRPFYAVKCNGDLALLEVLAAAGAGFDCASEAEMRSVIRLGVTADRIIFANACKRPSDIRAAKQCGVLMTTADSESELHKIAALYPEAQVLLRIRQDDPSARCQLGNKYGAEADDIPGLLETAKNLGLDLAGVSFHVGSGASNPDALPAGIATAAGVFAAAAAVGFTSMRVLDIGGGFPGGSIDAAGHVNLGRVPAAVNAALDAYFPPSLGVDIIAEPGRFFAETCATLVCQVFGSRSRAHKAEAPAASLFDYYITDGLYGSFNCVLYDHAVPTTRPLRSPALPPAPVGADAEAFPSTVFGPTCDGLDTVFQSVPLPALRNGDWLVFPAMGAYTLCGASNFNGIAAADVPTFYVQSQLAA